MVISTHAKGLLITAAGVLAVSPDGLLTRLISADTLTIAFSEDTQTPPARGKLIADTAPKGSFDLPEGLGHCALYGHRPDWVNQCIRKILSQYS